MLWLLALELIHVVQEMASILCCSLPPPVSLTSQHMTKSPLHIYIMQEIKDWGWEWPGNEASSAM